MPGDTFYFSRESFAKGRNGYFTLDGAKVWICSKDPQPIRIDLFSKRRVKAPPIALALTFADLQILRAVAEFATREYNAATAGPNSQAHAQSSTGGSPVDPVSTAELGGDTSS